MLFSELSGAFEKITSSNIVRLFSSDDETFSFLRTEYARDFNSRGRIELQSAIYIIPTLVALTYYFAGLVTAAIVLASCAPGVVVAYLMAYRLGDGHIGPERSLRYLVLSTLRDAMQGLTIGFLCIFLIPQFNQLYAVILLCILAGCHLGLSLLWRGLALSAIANISIIFAGIIISLHVNVQNPTFIFDILAVAFYFGCVRLLMQAQTEDMRNRTIAYERSKLLTEQSKANATLTKYSEQLAQQRTELEKLAWFDPLTGLPNRRSIKQFTAANAEDNIEHNWLVAVLDIDGFKAINDMVGHYAGDAVLCTAANRLKTFSDNNSISICGRLGGDEFILVSAVPHEKIDQWLDKLTTLFKGQIKVPGQNLTFTMSIGVAGASDDSGVDPGDLVPNADLALLEAKKRRGNNIVVFEASMLESRLEERRLATELRQALKNNALELYFQPKTNMLNNSVSGFEALLRWNNPRSGWIAPPRIVKLAEDNGLEAELAGFVISETVDFRQKLTGVREDFRVSFNLSPQNLLNLNVAEIIEENLKRTNLSGRGLEVEVTEEIFLDTAASMAQLAAIAKLGVNLAVDDFGAGFSSLSALRQIHFDVLKIDRAFAESIDSDERARTMFSVLAGIGERLGMEVVAEGIENEATAIEAQAMGVRTAQGYHYSRPLPEKEAIAFLNESRKPRRVKLASGF